MKSVVNENKRRYDNDEELIDTRKKYINYINNNKVKYQENWIKFCLGEDLFEIIKKKYYYDKQELYNACMKLNINDFDSYKEHYKLNNMLPPPNYINDGFYQDMDHKFNLNILLQPELID